MELHNVWAALTEWATRLKDEAVADNDDTQNLIGATA